MMLKLQFLVLILSSLGICDLETDNLVASFEAAGWIDTDTGVQQSIGSFIAPAEFRHHNYADLSSFLYNFAAKYPKLTYLYSIGKSVLGRDLLVIAISEDASVQRPGVPAFKYVANMHGNEVTGRELLLNLVEVLLVNYGRNEYLTRLVNTTSIHIMPTMNPDGYESAYEGDEQGIAGRRNAHYVDLNRNFPYRLRERLGTPEPETQAIMNWTKSVPFVLSANLHDGSSLVNYPYDDGRLDQSVVRTPDHNLFVRLAYSYARSHRYMWKKGPRCLPDIGGDPKSGITNGAEWYPVSGGMQDWNYVNADTFELTIEMNCQKFSYARDLPRLWDDHKYALIGYIDQVHKSLSGFVTDAYTGAGIDGASVRIEEGGKVVHSHAFGAYYRLLNPGTYHVTFEHPSYAPQSREFTLTTERPYLQMNATLQRRTVRDTHLLREVSSAYTGSGSKIGLLTSVLICLISSQFFSKLI